MVFAAEVKLMKNEFQYSWQVTFLTDSISKPLNVLQITCKVKYCFYVRYLLEQI